MNEKKERSRRLKQIKLTEKINSDANKILRLEIYRLARNRDRLGILLIIAAAIIATLVILLIKRG